MIADHPGNGTGGTAGADPGGGCPEQCGSFCTDAATSAVAAEAVAADAEAADLGATARQSATEGAAASESAPRRAVARSVASDGAEAAAADVAVPTKERPAPRRAARAVAVGD